MEPKDFQALYHFAQIAGRQQSQLQNPLLSLLQVPIMTKNYIENGNTTLIQLHHFVFNLARSGPISALIATNRTGFVPGEMIGFSAEVFLEDKKTSF